MIEKYKAVKDKHKKYKYYRGVPYISNKDFKNTKNYSLLGITKLQKNKRKPNYKYLYYQNTCYIIKDKIIGLKKGYIDIGNQNYLILKNNNFFLFLFIFILILFCFFISCNHIMIDEPNHHKDSPKVNNPLISKNEHDNPSKEGDETHVIKVNSKNYQNKSNIIKYKIHFDSNGGLGTMENIQYSNEQCITLNKNTFKRFGYKFLGWSTKKNGKIVYKDGQKISTLSLPKNKTIILYAIWEINTYHIFYQLNDGILENPINHYHIQSKDISINDPIKVGYTFLGWTENEKNEPVKDYVIPHGKYSDINLTAHYIPNKYNIHFNTQGGKENYKDKIISYDDIYGTLPIPTKKGYTFLGWKNESGQKVDSNTIFKDINDITLYADWSVNTYTIKLNPKEGTLNMEFLTVAYNNKYKNLPIPTRLGYTFDGWYYKGILVDNDTIMDKDFNHELYAKWEINTYTVTYLNANNTIYTTKTVTYFDTVPNINYSVDSYHVFKGWYDTGGNSIINKKYLTDNLTVKANVKEVNCYLITGQAQDHDTSRIARFEQLLKTKNLGGRWSLENGYYSYVSNSSNYSHIKEASNYLLANAPSTSWPYLVWLGMFCDNGHSEQLR